MYYKYIDAYDNYSTHLGGTSTENAFFPVDILASSSVNTLSSGAGCGSGGAAIGCDCDKDVLFSAAFCFWSSVLSLEGDVF